MNNSLIPKVCPWHRQHYASFKDISLINISTLSKTADCTKFSSATHWMFKETWLGSLSYKIYQMNYIFGTKHNSMSSIWYNESVLYVWAPYWKKTSKELHVGHFAQFQLSAICLVQCNSFFKSYLLYIWRGLTKRTDHINCIFW